MRINRLIALASLLTFCLIPQAAGAAGWMWIWAPEGARAPETLFFRQTIQLSRRPSSAKLMITADDTFRVWLNGGSVLLNGHDWSVVRELDMTPYLKRGKNVLAIEVSNQTGPGGLLYKLTIQLPGHKTLLFQSDKYVRVNRRVPPGWLKSALDDSRWPMATEVAPAGGGVWGKLRSAPTPDPARIIRLWDIRAGGAPGEDPYHRVRHLGERMILSTSVTNQSDMELLSRAGFTLFQTDSDHLSTEETTPGLWDFKSPEAARRLTRSLGLDWSYFTHYAFPPSWYRDKGGFTRLQCLEHHQPVAAFSVWEPKWEGFIDSGYTELARVFGGVVKPTAETKTAPAKGSALLSSIYVGIHGDFGEAGLMSGARVSDLIPSQKADWQRRFGDTHDHLGWWCDDPLARENFRGSMVDKYGSLPALNAAWKRNYKKPEEVDFPTAPSAVDRREWLDFANWYMSGVGHAVELNLSAARAHFPNTNLILPAGFGDEDLRGGNDNSLLARLAASHTAELRSTHGALRPFAENAATLVGRLGSACRFYGVPFWIEGSSGLDGNQTVERIFEAVSQGAKGYFDWAGSAVNNRDVYYRYARLMRQEAPVVDVAMFYPAQAQKLRPDQGFAPLFAQACTSMRDVANFDIVDDRMVLDGCLSRYRVLALWEGTIADTQTLTKISDWVRDGGVLVAYDFGKVTNFENDNSWFNEMYGYVNQIAPAHLTERFVGTVPAHYQLEPASPSASEFLGEGWYGATKEDGVTARWTGPIATVRLPVNPSKAWVLSVRAISPESTMGRNRRVLVNGKEVGRLETVGDVTYRFPLSTDVLDEKGIATVTFQSDTATASGSVSNIGDQRQLGVRILSLSMAREGASENEAASPPAGRFRRELDLRRLSEDWTRRYGKGLTIYYPANRKQLRGYLETLRRVIYHLSDIDAGRRDALPVDDDFDGTYTTLFTDKILCYNPKDTSVTRTITIPPALFAAWRGEVAQPTSSSWTLTLEPHSIGAIYLTGPPQELLFECEKFLELGGLKPSAYPDCSPGKGLTGIRLGQNAGITTRFNIETAGQYAIFTRCLHNNRPEPVDITLDGQPISYLNAIAGNTLLSGTVALSRGTHSVTMKARPGRDVRADYLLLTNDNTIAGYSFADHTSIIK